MTQQPPETDKSMTETVTVRVWEGHKHTDYDELLDETPAEYEMEPVEEHEYLPHDEHVVLADDIDNHRKYAFDVEADREVILHVETNDSYHSPVDGFTQGPSIERGLLYQPDDDVGPFKTEIWGRVRMRVEEAGDG